MKSIFALLLSAALLRVSAPGQDLTPADDFPNLPPGFPFVIQQNGTASASGTVDFGTVMTLSTVQAVRELVISNAGDADIRPGSVVISPLPAGSPLPPAPAGFSRVLTPPAGIIAPGRSTVIRIGAGGNMIVPAMTFAMQATIENSDSDENPCTPGISGTVENPEALDPAGDAR